MVVVLVGDDGDNGDGGVAASVLRWRRWWSRR